jgi:hypothetical protein
VLSIESLFNKSTSPFYDREVLSSQSCAHINSPNTSEKWTPFCFKKYETKHILLNMKRKMKQQLTLVTVVDLQPPFGAMD